MCIDVYVLYTILLELPENTATNLIRLHRELCYTILYTYLPHYIEVSMLTQMVVQCLRADNDELFLCIQIHVWYTSYLLHACSIVLHYTWMVYIKHYTRVWFTCMLYISSFQPRKNPRNKSLCMSDTRVFKQCIFYFWL